MTVRKLRIPTNFRLDEPQAEGQGLVEYALLIFLVSVASVGALTALGVGVKTQLYDVIVATLPF